MASLEADMDAISHVQVPESEARSANPVEDTMLAALFSTSTTQPPPPRECDKRHRSRENKESRSRKKERYELEAARRSSFVDEDARQMRARELAVAESISRPDDVERRDTEGADIAVDITDGIPTNDGVGSGKPNAPAC